MVKLCWLKCTRKKRLQREMTKDYYWIDVQENIGMFSNAGINIIHKHPSRTPGDLHQKLVPTLGLLHPTCCPGGGDLLGSSARGGHLSIKDFLLFFDIFIIMARLGD